MNFKRKILNFFKIIFPSTLTEVLLFSTFFLLYGCLGYYIATTYSIVFDERIPWDAYFSFDNRAIVLNGGGYERHPLANYYFDWIRGFSYWISDNKTNSVFRLALASLSNLMVSLTMVQMFKYLKNIVCIPNFINLLIVAFFGIFVTPILLSFTPETYTYTLFFLTFFNYYVALKLKKDEKLSLPALGFFSLAIGGLTITNIVKVYIPVLFEKKLFKNWKSFGWASVRVIISVALFIVLFLNRLNFKFENYFTKSTEQYEKFSKVKTTPLWDMLYSWFFGGSILFPGFTIRDYHNIEKTFYYKALFMDVYQTWLPYIFIGFVYLLIFWSYIKNFKNKLVQVLMLSFFVDILIHGFLKFGIHTAYIYGGHFVFIIPMMLGWLFYSYKNSPKILSFLFSSLTICFVYFALNNGVRLLEFIHFLDLFYKK